jgi:hypothetical protein
MEGLDVKLTKIQKQYNKYSAAYEGEFLDIDLPCKVADSVPFLLRTITELQNQNKNKYIEGYKMAKFDFASELLNAENDRRDLIDQWYKVATKK